MIIDRYGPLSRSMGRNNMGMNLGTSIADSKLNGKMRKKPAHNQDH